MKTLFYTSVTAVFLILLMGCSSTNQINNSPEARNASFKVPNDVRTILDNSCLQCHGSDGKFKPKLKWNFEKMAYMDNAKLISKLSKIEDVLTEGKMPPKKYVEKNPSHKLTKEHKKTITNWASSLAEEITKK